MRCTTDRRRRATLPTWCAERGVTVEPFGLELLPAVADLARSLLPQLAEPSGRIYIERPDRGPLITAWLDKPPG